MTREVDDHFDPCMQGPPTTTGGDSHVVTQGIANVKLGMAKRNIELRIEDFRVQ